MKPFNNHSPLPWKWEQRVLYFSEYTVLVNSFDGETSEENPKDQVLILYKSFHKPSQENLDFILHAVNTYYETHQLLDSVNETNKVLAETLESVRDLVGCMDNYGSLTQRIDAALNKAKENSHDLEDNG